MIPVGEAYQLIMGSVPGPELETLSLDHATGRILQEPVLAERDSPPFDRVMMDGFAIRYNQPLAAQFEIKGVALAGHEPPPLEQGTDCMEVTTGCPLPPGCDTVVPIEDCLRDGNLMRIAGNAGLLRGQYIHVRGSDGPAGRIVMQRGTFIGPPELAILATEGKRDVTVGRYPRIKLVTTGDEVVLDGGCPGPVQIRGSHFEALRGLLHQYPGSGFSRLHADDSPVDLRNKLDQAIREADILLITGGVSRGCKDLVPVILKELRVEQLLHRVAQRPGKPMWFGAKGRKLIFGLPGNPISALICARKYVFPAIEKWMGAVPRQPVRFSIAGKIDPLDGYTRFVPVRLGGQGGSAEPFTTSGSLHDLAGTDGFVEVPPRGMVPETLKFFPWNSR